MRRPWRWLLVPVLMLVLGSGLPVLAQQAQLINGNRTHQGATNYGLTTGTSTAYVLTLNAPITTYITGSCYLLKAHVANTGSATLNVNGVGAKILRKFVSGVAVALSANDISANQVVYACYDGTDMQVESLGGGISGGIATMPTASDQVLISDSTTAGTWQPLPNCPDTAGNHLNYNLSTNQWLCGTSGGTVGSVGFSAITGGTNSSAAMLVGTGASLAPTGTGSVLASAFDHDPAPCGGGLYVTDQSANGALVCNQVQFSQLGGPGVTDAQVPDLNTLSTGITASRCVQTDGAGHLSAAADVCGIGGGGGTVGTTGSPANGQTAEFTGLTTITGVANTGTGNYVKATSPTLTTPFLSGVNPQTGTTYTMVAGDNQKLVTFNNVAAVAVTLPPATTAGFTDKAVFYLRNIGVGLVTVTVTPATSTIDSAATLVLRTNEGAAVFSNGANYSTLRTLGMNPMTSPGDLIVGSTNGSALRLAVGTGVFRGNGASGPSYAELSGDVTTSGSNVTTVTRVNGATIPTNPSPDTVPLATATNVLSYRVLPNCNDTIGQHLNYDTATHVFSCGNSTRTVPAFFNHGDASAIDVNSDTVNEVRIQELTPLSVNLNAPTGTPIEGQRLRYSVFSTVSRLLTFTTTTGGFAATAGSNFPTRTIAGAFLILDFRWESQASPAPRWVLVSVSDRKPKLGSFGDVAAITPNSDTMELVNYVLGTATQAGYTINNPLGTPGDGQLLRVRFTTLAAAPAKGISWGSKFVGNAGIPTPTTTTGLGAQDVFGFSYNAGDDTWVMLATTQASLSARRRTCMMFFGGTNGPALVDADLVEFEFCSVPTNAVIEEIEISAISAGTPSVMVHRRTGATNTPLLTGTGLATAAAGGFACARPTAGATGFRGYACSSSVTLQNTNTTGEVDLGTTSGIASTTTPKVLIRVHYLLNS